MALYYWGNPNKGGSGTPPGSPPLAITNPHTVIYLDASNDSSLITANNGNVYAWGQNSVGQLGNGTTTASPSALVQATGIGTSIQTASGNKVAVALLSTGAGNGTLSVWGNNYTSTPSTPAALSGITTATAVTAGAGAMYALVGGQVYAWGNNSVGQLGQGTSDSTFHTTPVLVPGVSGVTQISSGNSFCLALLSSGAMMGWGLNTYGQLGDGTQTTQLSPVSCLQTGVSSVSAGGNVANDGHSLCILTNGKVMGWGNNTWGQLGNNQALPSTASPTLANGGYLAQLTPVQVLLPSSATITAVSAGGSHSMALDSAGNLYMWGCNAVGQLGDGGVHCSASPFILLGPNNALGNPTTAVTQMSAGSEHSVAYSG